MSKKNNIIEINGKRYDARSGVQLEHMGTPPTNMDIPEKLTKIPVQIHSAGQVITPTLDQTDQASNTIIKNKQSDSKLKTTRSINNRPKKPLQSSRTLMRQAVSKPLPSLKRQIKAQGPTDIAIKSRVLSAPFKVIYKTADMKRLKRAQLVSKSHLISRFNFSSQSPKAKDNKTLISPVVPTPINQTMQVISKSKHPKTTSELLHQVLRQTGRA